MSRVVADGQTVHPPLAALVLRARAGVDHHGAGRQVERKGVADGVVHVAVQASVTQRGVSRHPVLGDAGDLPRRAVHVAVQPVLDVRHGLSFERFVHFVVGGQPAVDVADQQGSDVDHAVMGGEELPVGAQERAEELAVVSGVVGDDRGAVQLAGQTTSDAVGVHVVVALGERVARVVLDPGAASDVEGGRELPAGADGRVFHAAPLVVPADLWGVRVGVGEVRAD